MRDIVTTTVKVKAKPDSENPNGRRGFRRGTRSDGREASFPVQPNEVFETEVEVVNGKPRVPRWTTLVEWPDDPAKKEAPAKKSAAKKSKAKAEPEELDEIPADD